MPRQPGVHLFLLERGVCGGGASARVSRRRRRAGMAYVKSKSQGGRVVVFWSRVARYAARNHRSASAAAAGNLRPWTTTLWAPGARAMRTDDVFGALWKRPKGSIAKRTVPAPQRARSGPRARRRRDEVLLRVRFVDASRQADRALGIRVRVAARATRRASFPEITDALAMKGKTWWPQVPQWRGLNGCCAGRGVLHLAP